VVTLVPAAVKFAVICPTATVTLDGTVRFVLLDASGTGSPPAEAADVNVTVHVEFPGVLMVAGLHVTPPMEDTTPGSDTDPEPPEPGMDPPIPVAASTPVI